MTLEQYQKEAIATATWETTSGMAVIYPTLGLCGETGEVAEKVKKVYRDNKGVFSEEKRQEIAKELGDVLWYLSSLARDLGYSLETIADINIAKLKSRRERGVIHGNGDNR